MERIDQNPPKKNKGNLWLGLILLGVGVVWILRQLDFPIADWLFSWELILIAIGFGIGFSNRFKDFGWLILVLIGGIFLFDDLFPQVDFFRFAWPVALIVLGFYIIFRATSKSRDAGDSGNVLVNMETGVTSVTGENVNNAGDEVLDCATVMGGIKKNIVTKNFRGGEVVTVFGGTELNLTQADINGTAVLEVVQIFGGTKLIVPTHWQVKSELASIFGGVDDKRIPSSAAEQTKVLVLQGTCIFGGIEIKSF
jgi:predicted membrane protein